jgi:hypothetical protein
MRLIQLSKISLFLAGALSASAIAADTASIVIKNATDSYNGNNFRLSLGLGNKVSSSNGATNGAGSETEVDESDPTNSTSDTENEDGFNTGEDEDAIGNLIILEDTTIGGQVYPYDYLTDGSTSGEDATFNEAGNQITFEILEAGRLKIDMGAPNGTFTEGPFASYGGLTIETLDGTNVLNAENVVLTKANSFTISPESVYAGTITTPFSLQKGKYKVSAYSGAWSDTGAVPVSFYEFSILPSTPMPTTNVEVLSYSTDSTYPMSYNVTDGDIDPEIDERFEAGSYNRNRDVNTQLKVDIKKSGYVVLHTNVKEIQPATYYMLSGPNAPTNLGRYEMFQEFTNAAGNIAYITTEKVVPGAYDIWTDSNSDEYTEPGTQSQFELASVFITEVEITDSPNLSSFTPPPFDGDVVDIDEAYIGGEFVTGASLLDGSTAGFTTIAGNDYVDVKGNTDMALRIFLSADGQNGANYGSIRISDPDGGSQGGLMTIEGSRLFENNTFDLDLSGFTGGWVELPFKFMMDTIRISASEGSNLVISEFEGEALTYSAEETVYIADFASVPSDQTSVSIIDKDTSFTQIEPLQFRFTNEGSYLLVATAIQGGQFIARTNTNLSQLGSYRLEFSSAFSSQSGEPLLDVNGSVISESGVYTIEPESDPSNGGKAMFKTPFGLDFQNLYQVKVVGTASSDVYLTEIEFQ